jgi:hypothetical protein
MKVYKSTSHGGLPTCYNIYTDVLEEFKMFLDNAITGDKMEYEILEMSEEEFQKIDEL